MPYIEKDFSLVSHIDKKTSICFFDDHQNVFGKAFSKQCLTITILQKEVIVIV
jgi:hypothetical protein